MMTGNLKKIFKIEIVILELKPMITLLIINFGLKDLKRIRIITKKPIIAIGGINEYNYKKLLLNKADFLAISSFIWKNKKLKPEEAIEKIK